MSLSPDITVVLDRLRAGRGVVEARMSGSGSACFGLFDDDEAAAAAAATLAQEGIWAVATRF